MDRTTRTVSQTRGIRVTAAGAVIVVSAMTGLVAAAEPLYRLFCQVTGYGGTPRVAQKASDTVSAQTMTVRFDANVNRDLPWRFHAAATSVTLPIGEERLAFYEATNVSQKPLVGTATFNVLPEKAAVYFNKIQCFCFTEQVLAPGETVQMPVSFFIDPAILDDPSARDVKSVTLSYTFFLNQDQSKAQTHLTSYSN